MIRLRGALCAMVLLGVVSFVAFYRFFVSSPVRFGFTFSVTHAQYLGQNPLTTYQEALHDLRPDVVRIPVYWNRIAPLPTERYWEELDELLKMSQEAHTEVILAVGSKVPRYPECYVPHWVEQLSYDDQRLARDAFLHEVVARYRASPALVRWQVENEPLYSFGKCPRIQTSDVAREIRLIREDDPAHPIMLTVSGEQQLWATTAMQADVLGTSIYRFAQDAFWGAIVFPHGPLLYRLQALSVRPFTTVVVSELQAEPWFAKSPLGISYDVAASRFTPEDLRRNTVFALQTGLREISFWGVEWWAYLRLHGHPELWEAARDIMNPT